MELTKLLANKVLAVNLPLAFLMLVGFIISWCVINLNVWAIVMLICYIIIVAETPSVLHMFISCICCCHRW